MRRESVRKLANHALNRKCGDRGTHCGSHSVCARLVASRRPSTAAAHRVSYVERKSDTEHSSIQFLELTPSIKFESRWYGQIWGVVGNAPRTQRWAGSCKGVVVSPIRMGTGSPWMSCMGKVVDFSGQTSASHWEPLSYRARTKPGPNQCTHHHGALMAESSPTSPAAGCVVELHYRGRVDVTLAQRATVQRAQ
jgi:hypothetical protein